MRSFILRNNHFDISPIVVELKVQPEDGEGWREFTLKLVAGAPAAATVAECAGSLSREDFAFLFDSLEAATRGTAFDFSPLESWFILRVQEYSEQEVEMLWVVDQGMARQSTGTDTGIGVLIIVSKADLADALAASA